MAVLRKQDGLLPSPLKNVNDCEKNSAFVAFGLWMYVGVFMALITTLVLCAKSQDLVMPVSVRRVRVALYTVGFKGGGKPCPKTRETAALRRGI